MVVALSGLFRGKKNDTTAPKTYWNYMRLVEYKFSMRWVLIMQNVPKKSINSGVFLSVSKQNTLNKLKVRVFSSSGFRLKWSRYLKGTIIIITVYDVHHDVASSEQACCFDSGSSCTKRAFELTPTQLVCLECSSSSAFSLIKTTFSRNVTLLFLARWTCRSPHINETIMASGEFGSKLSFGRLVHYHPMKQAPVTTCDDGNDCSVIEVWRKLTLSPIKPWGWQHPLVVEMSRTGALTPVTSWESRPSSPWKYTQRLYEIMSKFTFHSSAITVCAWLHLETTSWPQNETWANNQSPTSSWWKVKQSFQLVSAWVNDMHVWANKHLHLVFISQISVCLRLDIHLDEHVLPSF